MPVRGVIFDLGGTLLSLPPVDQGQVKRACDAHLVRSLIDAGLSAPKADEVMEATRAQLRDHQSSGSLRQFTMEANLKRALRASAATLTPRGIRAAALAWLEPELGLWRPVDGAAEVLTALRGAGVRVGLCSNSACHAYTVRLVAVHDLDRHLDPMVSSSSAGWRKPHPRAFQTMLAAWGLPPEDVVMVGDDLACDVAGAAALGMGTVWVTAHSAMRQGDHHGPTPWRTVPRLRDLPEVILA